MVTNTKTVKKLEKLEKLMSVVAHEGEIKPGDRLYGGTTTEIKFWLNSGWILPNSMSNANMSRPSAFHVTKFALDSFEDNKKHNV